VADYDQYEDELSKLGSPAYRLILSLDEETAKLVDYVSKDKWVSMLRKIMPEVADELGIDINHFNWVAAMHKEKGHPHVHVICYENLHEGDRDRLSERIEIEAIRKIKRYFAQEIYAEQRNILGAEKTATRDQLKNEVAEDIKALFDIVKNYKSNADLSMNLNDDYGTSSIPPKFKKQDVNEIFEKLKDIAIKLPLHGRIAYQFMPTELKKEIEQFVDKLLLNNEYRNIIIKNQNVAAEYASMFTKSEDKLQEAKNNAYEDLKSRMENVILKAANNYRREVISKTEFILFKKLEEAQCPEYADLKDIAKLARCFATLGTDIDFAIDAILNFEKRRHKFQERTEAGAKGTPEKPDAIDIFDEEILKYEEVKKILIDYIKENYKEASDEGGVDEDEWKTILHILNVDYDYYPFKKHTDYDAIRFANMLISSIWRALYSKNQHDENRNFAMRNHGTNLSKAARKELAKKMRGHSIISHEDEKFTRN
jgi:hypothetical protein